MTCSRLALAFGITAAFGAWLYLVTRQHAPMLLFSMHVLFVTAIAYSMWSRLQRMSWWIQGLIGASIGYTASVFAVAVVTLALYGTDQFFDRFLPSSLYVYPLISFGWLYGVLVIAAVCWRGHASFKSVSR